MPRLKLTLPETLPYRTELDVRVSDVNYAGHLGNDVVLSFVHEARIRYLRSLGFTELECGGAGIIMTDAEIVYRAEAFHGDVLHVEVGLGALSSRGCEIFTRLRAPSGGEVAVARTGFVFFDYQSRKVVAVPAVFRARVESGDTPERA